MFKEIEPKTIPEEIEALHNLPSCKHCKKNDKAEKPFSKLKKVELTPLTERIIKQEARQYGIKEESCILCLTIDNFAKLPADKRIDYLKATKQESPN